MWKIAYADFMTAMMALFLVLWLISTSTEEELLGIAEYFRDPLAKENNNPFSERKEDLFQLVESVPKLWALREHFKIDLVREGLRIEIVMRRSKAILMS